jgi:hypothetical protein
LIDYYFSKTLHKTYFIYTGITPYLKFWIQLGVWDWVSTYFLFKKFLKILLLQINSFSVFGSFWCTSIKNKFLKIKNIILMYFRVKNTLKKNFWKCNSPLMKSWLRAFLFWELKAQQVSSNPIWRVCYHPFLSAPN